MQYIREGFSDLLQKMREKKVPFHKYHVIFEIKSTCFTLFMCKPHFSFSTFSGCLVLFIQQEATYFTFLKKAIGISHLFIVL